MVGSGLGMGRTMKVIVSGARGCGKTSILEKVIYDNNGVSAESLRMFGSKISSSLPPCNPALDTNYPKPL